MSLNLEKENKLSCSQLILLLSSRKTRPLAMRSVGKHTVSQLVVLFGFLLIALASTTDAQSIKIEKTIKEELLPGSVVAELTNEPELKILLENAKTASNGNGSVQFNVLSANNPNADYFTLEPNKGVISIRKRLDRETVCSFRSECVLEFEFALRSVLGSFFRIAQFEVTVLDINDNSPEFTQPQFELFVPEESDAGKKFPLPTAFDRDTGPGNGVSDYQLLDAPPMFDLITEETILNTTDVFLKLDSVVNREKAESYKILVGAVDGGKPSLTGTLTVEVRISDINDNFPVFKQPVYKATIPEDFGRDQPVTTVTATDADSGANGALLYTFSNMQPFENLKFFHIDSTTGSIYLTRTIETRTGQRIELIVEAQDKGHPPKATKAKVEIFVEDTVNSMPVIIADALGGANGVAEVSEYAQPGKVVAHVSVTDPDSGPNGETSCGLSAPEFQLESLGSTGGKFTAVLRASLDRETTDHYNVTVTCKDEGVPALVATGQFAVRVLDENDMDPVFEPRAYDANIFENNTVGASIVQLYATDGDIGVNAKLSYDVAGINHKKFTVDSDGLMTALIPLDREDSQRIVVTVLATDGGIPTRSATATVVVNLIDVNDCRPEFDLDVFEFSVEEGQPAGKFVGIVSASDQDDGTNQQVFYHFPDHGQISRLFRVDLSGGIISTGAVLDRENVAMHTVIVLATDRGDPPLTGTATVVIKVLDVNDNDPVFVFPLAARNSDSGWENDSLSIPHSWNPAKPLATVKANDKDEGLNAEIMYTLSSINYSAPFSMNPSTGAIMLKGELSPEDVGLYIMTVAATDQGPKQQRATQAPLYIDVFFDNSTLLLGTKTRGPSQALVLGIIGGVAVLVLACLVGVVFVVCFKRGRTQRKLSGGVPNSVSTSSTAKLQGGYYIAPGVRGSSDSILASKHGSRTGTFNSAVSPGGDASITTPLTNGTDDTDGMRSVNPYVVMLPRSESVAPSEIIEISRTGRKDTADLDATEDATMFSTFRSEEDILSSGFRNGSLRRPSHDAGSIAKRSAANDTFDELSNDDSTSDSGRGGSEVDINNGAAAANKEKARAMAATPVSMKSGISNRLSPLPQGIESDYGQRTLVTFRGESPNSFRFDSDSDTLTRRRGRIPNSSGFPAPLTQFHQDGDSDAATSPSPLVPSSFRRFDFNGPPSRLSESDGTDSELGAAAAAVPPRGRFQNMRRPLFPAFSMPSSSSTPHYPNPQHIAGIYTANVPGASHLNGYNSGGEGGPSFSSSFLPSRQPFRVPPLLPMHVPPSSYQHQSRPESESEAQLSDSSGSTNPTNRYRSNHVPRLPYYPGIEFSHHAYGGSNRNSIGAFSNNSALSNTDPPYHYYGDQNNVPTSFAGEYQPRGRALSNSTSSNGGSSDPARNVGPDARVSMNYGNVVSELQTSRPVSMEADFHLPPYPEVNDPLIREGEDEENELHVHSGYTGFSPHRDSEREALFTNSKLESSA